LIADSMFGTLRRIPSVTASSCHATPAPSTRAFRVEFGAVPPWAPALTGCACVSLQPAPPTSANFRPNVQHLLAVLRGCMNNSVAHAQASSGNHLTAKIPVPAVQRPIVAIMQSARRNPLSAHMIWRRFGCSDYPVVTPKHLAHKGLRRVRLCGSFGRPAEVKAAKGHVRRAIYQRGVPSHLYSVTTKRSLSAAPAV
jgi:hypothetical protein